MMGADKLKAKQNTRRIPESRLLGAAILGGSIGVWSGMKVFVHKTRQAKFVFGLPLIILIQAALAAFISNRIF